MVMMAPMRACGVAHGRSPIVLGQRINEAVPLTIEPAGGAGTLTVMISGATDSLGIGKKAGSAGSELSGIFVGLAVVVVCVVESFFGESLPINAIAGRAIRLITATSARRRRSVKVNIGCSQAMK